VSKLLELLAVVFTAKSLAGLAVAGTVGCFVDGLAAPFVDAVHTAIVLLTAAFIGLFVCLVWALEEVGVYARLDGDTEAGPSKRRRRSESSPHYELGGAASGPDDQGA
jgi:hypothetical protein